MKLLALFVAALVLLAPPLASACTGLPMKSSAVCPAGQAWNAATQSCQPEASS